MRPFAVRLDLVNDRVGADLPRHVEERGPDVPPRSIDDEDDVLAPDHAVMMFGVQGWGVSTPSFSAVAAFTAGLPIDEHIPNGRLRQHHATHHRPELMQTWNFNVNFPLWDWVRGTTYKG